MQIEYNGKIIGEIKKNGDFTHFIKIVERKKHRMKKFNAYGIQKEIFDKHLRGERGLILIKEKDTGNHLYSSIKQWEEEDWQKDFGFGEQMFLREDKMIII